MRTCSLAIGSCLLMLILFPACQKDIREQVIVWGNTPPPYHGMSTEQLQVLSNRIYIDLLGRGPTQVELDNFLEEWKEEDFSAQALDAQILSLQQSAAYFRNMDVIFWAKCLNSIDSLSLESEIALYNYVIELSLEAGDTTLAYFYEPFRDGLIRLKEGAGDWRNGEIGIEEYMGRIINNVIYDNVNMGSENYVLACFENLYFRKPTAYELEQAILMVGGVSGFLFLQDGNSRLDFVHIATHSAPFYEGLVLEAYRHLLGSVPDAAQMAVGLQALGSSSDYQSLQRSIIIGPLYANLP